MYSLGIDTSNYATSLAVYDTEGQTSPVMLKRFLPVRAGALGLRQSDALFHHTAALPELFEELKKKTNLKELSAVGVSVKPRPVEGSYMPCFLVGRAAACAIGAATGIPVVETSHQQGHIAAALYAAGGDPAEAGKAGAGFSYFRRDNRIAFGRSSEGTVYRRPINGSVCRPGGGSAWGPAWLFLSGRCRTERSGRTVRRDAEP